LPNKNKKGKIMGYLEKSYRDLNPTKTDMYQLTMAQGYFDQGRQEEEATFYMHWRNPPFGGGYTVAAGLEGVVDFLNNFKFDEEKIAYLRTLEKKGERLFSEEFLNYLANSKLNLQVDAVPEGTAMLGQGPALRITGSLVQAQLVESAILNIMNSASIIATRGARIDEAGQGRPFADFSLRRSGTLDAGVSRASYIGGAAFTADVDAARVLGIPPTGTMAHSWIMGFKAAFEGYVEAKKAGIEWISPYYTSDDREFFENNVKQTVDAAWPNVGNSELELIAFKAYLKSMANNSVLLVDTFDPVQGVKNAIRAAIEMNVELDGVRLDSGDLYALSWEAKALLDEARQTHPELFNNTKIFATDGLDEKSIHAMQKRSIEEKGEKLPIQVYGVGTELGNPGPLRGGVYKISASEIIHEDFEANLENGEVKTAIVNQKVVPITKDMVRTMKVAGVDKNDPSLPGPKSSMPGVELNTLRLKDANGKILADVIIDESLRRGDNWRELLQDGIVDTAGNKIDVGEVASAETLLKPIFVRQKDAASKYVYNEHGAPKTKPAYKGGPEVTDLDEIKTYARAQRASLSEEIKRLDDPKPQIILMDPLVLKQRQAIMASMNKPGTDISGSLEIAGGKSPSMAA